MRQHRTFQFAVVLFASVLALSPVVSAARVQKGPEAAAKYKSQADSLRAEGRLDEALKNYRSAVEADPTNLGNAEEYGKALFGAGKYKEAAALYRQLTSQDDPVAYWNLGSSLAKVRDYAGAAEAYAAFEKATPEDVDVYYSLAECYRQLKRYQDAADQYDLYTQKETRESERSWIDKAKTKSVAMKAEASKPVTFTASSTISSGTSVTVAMPGNAAPETPPTAAPVVAPAPAPVATASPYSGGNRDPNAAIARIRDGDLLFKQGRYREALFTYQDAIKLDDQSISALLKEGLAYAV